LRQVIIITIAFIFGLAPLAVAATIGISIYASFPNTTGIVIIGLLVVLSIWIGLNIFKSVQKVGPIEFMTAVHATPELDNLEPTKGRKAKRKSSKEIDRNVENKDH